MTRRPHPPEREGLSEHQGARLQVMIDLIKAAPFWDRGEDWLACRASVMAAIASASTGLSRSMPPVSQFP